MVESSSPPAVRPTTDENSVVQEISILLRDGRLDLGESVEEVARTLRINRRYIEAIETGHFDTLPGSVYAIGFIRSFGDHVGLDGEDLVRRFKEASSSTKRPTELEFPEPIPESGVPGGAILFVGFFVAAFAYGGWYMLTEEDSIISDLVAPVPEELVESTEIIASEMISDGEMALNLENESPSPVDDQSEPTSGEALVEQAETELEAALDEVVDEIAEPPLTETVTVTAAEANVESVVEPVVESVTETTVDTVDETVEGSAETIEGTVGEVAEQITVPEAMPGPAEVEDPEPGIENAESGASEDSEIAQAADLNAQQLQSMQTGMIDAPALETTTESVLTPESGPEPQSEPVTAPQSDVPESSVPEEDTEFEEVTQEEVAREEIASVTVDPNMVDEIESQPAAVIAGQDDVNPNQVVIVAREDSWVEVRDNSIDIVLLSRVMKTGERFEVPIGGNLELQTGNIGALEFFVGGEPLSAIGQDGEIGRNISLSASSLISRQGGSGR